MRFTQKSMRTTEMSKGQPKNYNLINLKELRDQIFQRRISNGKLFMYGLANEGRLGVVLEEIMQNEKSGKDEQQVTKRMQLVAFKDVTI